MEKLIGLPIAFLTIWALIPKSARRSFWLNLFDLISPTFSDSNVMREETTFYLNDYMDRQDIAEDYERRTAKRIEEAHLDFTDLLPIVEETPAPPEPTREKLTDVTELELNPQLSERYKQDKKHNKHLAF